MSGPGWGASACYLLRLGIVVLLPVGCAAQHTPEVWVGRTFERLHRAFGDPSGILINERNNRIYAFRFDSTLDAVADSPSDATPLVYGDATLALDDSDCVILFELSAAAVSSWDWQGDGCGRRPIPLPYQFP